MGNTNSMIIYPKKSEYINLSKEMPRVPLCGQICIPNLNPTRLYYELFANSKDSFIFESIAGFVKELNP